MSFQPGKPFNPYRMFTGLFIPEALACCPSISAGAKLAWGRLARYSGMDGQCYPTLKTLGVEIGVGERQAQKYVAELERAKLIRRVSRFAKRAQTSNAFEFLWHEMLARGVNYRSGEEGVNDDSPRGANDSSPKESQFKESQRKEHERPGLPRRESQKARFTPGDEAARCRRHPKLTETLSEYMQEDGQPERIYPSERAVVDIMDAARPATELEVIDCLRYLREERGLKPGTRHGPRHFSWFRTAVADYFRQKEERRLPAPASAGGRSGNRGGLSEEVFDAMTDVLEIDAGASQFARREDRKHGAA